ncbi:uncharacterized protein [Drosophila kikkawai]|uniref:Uncharacterized protein n=1 Tax=Drosophila kikkawai TaxID=30033 RepID=A0A6P4HYN8_DROKI|nr:mediator of RNA polymerase II transcription subunit 15-like isoform X2 [Drosophila kikkawai]
MNYNHRYVKHPRYTCTGAPPERHAPAHFQRRGPASSSAWHGRQFQSPASRHVQSQSTPTRYVQSQTPTFSRTPTTFGTTPGYYLRGCWYNASLPEQVQPEQQQHVPQYYMTAQAEQEQHLPLSYQSEQVGSSSYPLQEQQQLSLQEQQQQLPSQEQEQSQILAQSYQLQQPMPSSGTSQPQFILLPAYPSQEQQPQQVILQAYPYQQPQQIFPQSEQQQPISFPSYSQQQRVRPSLRSQRYHVAPQTVAATQAMPAALLGQAPLLSQVPLLGQAPTIESPRNQVAQVSPAVEAARPEEDAAQPDEVVEINLGPGIYATRCDNKITIDIGLSCVDIAVAERRRDVGDLMDEALNLIRGYIHRRRLPRRQRTRLRHRRPTVQRVLISDKDTQTVDPWESDEELASDDPESMQVSPSTSRTLTQEEFLSPQSAGVWFEEEDEGNDLICDQATKGLSDPDQLVATKPTQSEGNSLHWKPKEAVTDPPTTPKILQNSMRIEENRAQSNEPGVSRVPACSRALKAPPSRSLSSANKKMMSLNSRQVNMDSGGQMKRHSLRGLKQNKSEPMLIAGNMFALLDEPGAEPPPPLEINSKPAGKVKDHLDPQKLAAKRAKKQRKNFKKKERIRAARLKAQEKAATEVKGTPTLADNNSGLDGKQCEIQFLGEILFKGLTPPTIPKEDKPLKFLLIGGGDVAEETLTETRPAKEGDPPAKIPGQKEESPSLGARKGRRSQFLEAVAGFADALKSPKEKEPPAKRNLWEKRRK